MTWFNFGKNPDNNMLIENASLLNKLSHLDAENKRLREELVTANRQRTEAVTEFWNLIEKIKELADLHP